MCVSKSVSVGVTWCVCVCLSVWTCACWVQVPGGWEEELEGQVAPWLP